VIPDKIGSYLIEKKIGSGGMGTVYLGKHVDTGQLAAVKVLPASLAREEGFVMRFTREVDAMKALKNKYVVQVYENGIDNDETYYYAMEYVEGTTLSNYIRNHGRIAWQDVIAYSVQICQALKAAHDAGIVHRDLKPSNLILTDNHEIKLLDFGVAQVFASSKLTKTGGIIGTAEYMSPEQAKGQRATKKSDIYSLGAVMYAMLTARPPFSGQSSMEVIQKHRFGQFDRPRTYVPEIPHWLDDVVCQCLEKDPDKRYPDAYVLSLRLKEILKKVEISSSLEDTHATGTFDGTAETIVAESSDPNAIGGTFMRDMLRAEIENANSGSPFARYFDNVWILVLLLIALLAGGIFWFTERPLTEDEKYEKGIALFQQGPLYWPRAKDEYLQPLLEEDPERWEEKVEPILAEIIVQELKQEFGLTRLSRKRVLAMSDAHRFLKMASEYFQLGDRTRAEAILQNLYDLLANNTDQRELRRAIGEILTEIKTISPDIKSDANSVSLAQEALQQARTLLMESEPEQAQSILRSLIVLYDGDSMSQKYVDEARQLLNATVINTPESPTP